MIPFRCNLVLARLLNAEVLPRGKRYHLLGIQPHVKPGATATIAINRGEPFEVYQCLFSTAEECPALEHLYEVTGYIQGMAWHNKNIGKTYYTPRVILTSLTKYGECRLAFDPVTHIEQGSNLMPIAPDPNMNAYTMLERSSP